VKDVCESSNLSFISSHRGSIRNPLIHFSKSEHASTPRIGAFLILRVICTAVESDLKKYINQVI